MTKVELEYVRGLTDEIASLRAHLGAVQSQLSAAEARLEGRDDNFPKIRMIRLVRTLTGCSLAQAKDHIDNALAG